MGNDTMDLEQLARYLRRDAREVAKLVTHGSLPGRKVGGAWRFAKTEINHWLETQLSGYNEDELKAVESHPAELHESLLTNLLPEACVAVPLVASTRASVLKELVVLAEQSWQVYDPVAIHAAVRARAELGTIALEGGVALPHPRQPIPGALGESLVAFGKTSRGIPFGAPDRGLTDLFFLILCENSGTHLKVLARLSRLILRPGFLDGLRNSETPVDALVVIRTAEQALLATDGQ